MSRAGETFHGLRVGVVPPVRSAACAGRAGVRPRRHSPGQGTIHPAQGLLAIPPLHGQAGQAQVAVLVSWSPHAASAGLAEGCHHMRGAQQLCAPAQCIWVRPLTGRWLRQGRAACASAALHG